MQFKKRKYYLRKYNDKWRIYIKKDNSPAFGGFSFDYPTGQALLRSINREIKLCGKE